MHWLLAPLDKHSDDGFGAMASAFKEAAEALPYADDTPLSMQNLPACFLLRHASELFLKSALMVTHRRLQGDATGLPMVIVDGKSRPLTNAHSLQALYTELVALLDRNKAKLATITTTDWASMPPELDAAISQIEGMDARGVFFRYPTVDNAKKSKNQPITPEQIGKWDKQTQGPLKAMLVLDANNDLVEAFHFQPDLLAQELHTLKEACEALENIHIGLRMELAGGW